MQLGVSLRQAQEQRLQLLPKMLQAIEVLQLSTHDLLLRIETELADNPTLELSEPEGEAPRERDPASERYDDVDDYARGAPRSEDEGRRDWLAQVADRSIGLHDDLLSQLALSDADEATREVVAFLIGSLDANGHLVLDETELADVFGDQELVSRGVGLLQSFDPPGVGQVGPRECMIAQVDPDDPDYDLLVKLIEDELEELAKNRLPAVAKRLRIEVAELKLLIERLRDLEPCPGRAFANEEDRGFSPDVVVRREDGAWQVYVDDARIPELAVSDEYDSLARSAATDVRKYLRGQLNSARDLVAAIAQRKRTLGRVARAALARQRAFLERGPSSIVPLGMQEVADAVGVHLSTVSRAIADKFVQTDFGVFPLRRLFDGGQGVGGGESGKAGESRASVQERVRRLVADEDPGKPLSDDAIVKKLAEQGLEVARRTVAKYRKQLGIPSSWRRRSY